MVLKSRTGSSYGEKIKEMISLLEKEMKTYGDAAPLVVADPAPAKWEPPVQNNSARKGSL